MLQKERPHGAGCGKTMVSTLKEKNRKTMKYWLDYKLNKDKSEVRRRLGYYPKDEHLMPLLTLLLERPTVNAVAFVATRRPDPE